MMKPFCTAIRIMAFFLLASAGQILPLTVKSCVMTHSQSKKRVVMFDDAHSSYLKAASNPSDHTIISQLYNDQKQFFTTVAQALLDSDPKQGAQTIVITETGNNLLGCLVEQEAGATEVINGEETIEILPRIFFQQLFAPASTVDTKMEIFKSKIQPFNNAGGASFKLHNNMRWIAADRYRTEEDSFLSFVIYSQWDKIIESINAHEELPQELAKLTIGDVKEYIDQLHASFEESNINDLYYQKIADVIVDALATQHLKESDHFAFLHKHLFEKDSSTIRDEFNNNMISFISQKFDVELISYFNAFDEDQSLNCAFIITGGEHNKQVRKLLLEKGYVISQEAGIDVDENIIKDPAQLSNLLKNMTLNAPFVDMKKIVGLDLQQAQKNAEDNVTPIRKIARKVLSMMFKQLA